MRDQPALIFLHHPKAGGTTLRQLLMSRFPPPVAINMQAHLRHPLGVDGWDRRRLRYQRYVETGRGTLAGDDGREWPRRVLMELPEPDRERLRLIVGHLAFGIHEVLPQPSTYITMLREPVNRILSWWSVWRDRGISIGFHEYLQTARDWELNNGQVRRVLGSSVPRSRWVTLSPRLLELAKRNLRERFHVVGVVERYDDMLALLGRSFGWRRLPHQRLNVTPERIRKEDLSPRLLARLEDLNRYDLELHRYAGELLDEHLARGRPRA